MSSIAIINSVLDYGSTGQLARELYKAGNSLGYDMYMFYGRGKRQSDKHIIKIDFDIEVLFHKLLSLLTGYQGYFSRHATSKLIKTLIKKNISKVILLNLHGYYLNENCLFDYLKKNHVFTIYISPDEYPGLGKCCYNLDCNNYKTECKNCPSVKQYPTSLFFDRSNTIFNDKKNNYKDYKELVLVGPLNNINKFKQSALTKNIKMKELSWGIDLGLYNYELDTDICIKYNIPNDKIIILTVAKYSAKRKGVKDYFFEVAKRMVDTNYHFINVGYDGNLTKEEMPSNMTTIGYINDQRELSKIYSLADLYLLPSTSDTMPLSCLIALACGTPICCFYTSGLKFLVPEDSLAIKYIYDINVDAIKSVLLRVNKKDKNTMLECRRVAKDRYSIETFTKKIFDIFGEEI